VSKLANRGYAFRKLRTRSRIFGTADKPRLSVYRSLKHIYAQVVDDLAGKTLVAAGSNTKDFGKFSGVAAASKVGDLLAKKALAKGVKAVVFDRGGRLYHGQIKALAEAARQGGLKF
jgi:large subunit ribosomal protein L18